MKSNKYNNYPENAGFLFLFNNKKFIIKNNSAHYKVQIEFVQSNLIGLNTYLGFDKNKYFLDANTSIIAENNYKNHELYFCKYK